MVLQPLISGLTKFRFKHVLYYKDDCLMLSLGNTVKPYYTIETDPKSILSGTKNVIPEITYRLDKDSFSLVTKGKSFISKSDLNKLEALLRECYNFSETHYITKWKN